MWGFNTSTREHRSRHLPFALLHYSSLNSFLLTLDSLWQFQPEHWDWQAVQHKHTLTSREGDGAINQEQHNKDLVSSISRIFSQMWHRRRTFKIIEYKIEHDFKVITAPTATGQCYPFRHQLLWRWHSTSSPHPKLAIQEPRWFRYLQDTYLQAGENQDSFASQH